MHFCNDELQVLLAFFQSLPFLGTSRPVMWLRSWMRRRQPHCCDQTHENGEKHA